MRERLREPEQKSQQTSNRSVPFSWNMNLFKLQVLSQRKAPEGTTLFRHCFFSSTKSRWIKDFSCRETWHLRTLRTLDCPSCFRCSCTGLATSQGWKPYVCPTQSSSTSSKKERVIMALQESVTKTSWRDSLYRRESTISHGSMRPQTETAGAHQWKSQSQVRGREAWSRNGKMQEA